MIKKECVYNVVIVSSAFEDYRESVALLFAMNWLYNLIIYIVFNLITFPFYIFSINYSFNYF